MIEFQQTTQVYQDNVYIYISSSSSSFIPIYPYLSDDDSGYRLTKIWPRYMEPGIHFPKLGQSYRTQLRKGQEDSSASGSKLRIHQEKRAESPKTDILIFSILRRGQKQTNKKLQRSWKIHKSAALFWFETRIFPSLLPRNIPGGAKDSPTCEWFSMKGRHEANKW